MSAEKLVVTNLRMVLDGLPIGADITKSEHFPMVCLGLERFIPTVLAEIYQEWKGASLDGLNELFARKSAEREMEFLGLCWLMSDQTQLPLHVRLQIPPLGEEISFLECKLGERGAQGMKRIKGSSAPQLFRHLRALAGRENSIDWVYKVTFGTRTPK